MFGISGRSTLVCRLRFAEILVGVDLLWGWRRLRVGFLRFLLASYLAQRLCMRGRRKQDRKYRGFEQCTVHRHHPGFQIWERYRNHALTTNEVQGYFKHGPRERLRDVQA